MRMSRAALAVVFALSGSGAVADDGPKDEIRIGQTLPYSGPLSGFGIIGRAQEAYFEKVNAEGGINGRKIKFISLDDAYSPPKTVEQTRKLVEQEEVLVMFGSLGTATNNAVAELNWKPDLFFVPTSASSISFLEPGGLENAVGLISSSIQKDTMDAQWVDDAGVKAYFAFMKQYLPNADLSNSNYAAGYHFANLMVKVLKACKDDFSRENILKQATSLHELSLPLLLPGITVSTDAEDYLPFQQLRLRRFDGKSWVGFGEILDGR